MEQEMEQEKGAEASQTKNEVWEWTKALVIAAALVFLIRVFIFSPFIVDGPSMEPNFYTGERLIVNKIIYSIRKPERGEVVVFHAPQGKDYIKRVIALPGETIKIENNKVYVNNTELKEDYIEEIVKVKEAAGVKYNDNFAETVVPEGMIFVMGDNRLNSSDSRVPYVGPVPYDKVIGRADIIFWPLKKIELVRH